VNRKNIALLNVYHFHPKGQALDSEIEWRSGSKPETLDLKDYLLKIKHTRGTEVMYLEIRIGRVVMNCVE
jgi:hypothetical protein